MATPLIAASAAAFGLYVYLKQGKASGSTAEAWRDVEHPPNNFREALYYFTDALRYFFTETLGRWQTVDLFVGLAYLSHRETLEYAALDIANHGQCISVEQTDTDKTQALLEELKEVSRYLLYCRGLKYRKEEQQTAFWKEHLQLEPSRVLSRCANAGLLRPTYVLLADDQMRCIIVCIRGTQGMKDMFTSLAATTKPHHKVQANGVVLGYSHLGMLAAARWLMKQIAPAVRSAMADHEGYRLSVIGHSMGAGIGALLTTMLRETVPGCADARCYALACPACMTLELAQSCKGYVTSVINGTDVVPTFSAASTDALRENIMHSSWFVEFQRDMRLSFVHAVQGGLRGVATATQWTARNILQPAYLPLTACYGRGGAAWCGGAAADAGSGFGPGAEPGQQSWPYRAPAEQQLPQQGEYAGSPPPSSSHHHRGPSMTGTWVPASHMGGTLSAHQLRRRLWPWGHDRERSAADGAEVPDTGSVSYEAAASVAFAGWLPDSTPPRATSEPGSADHNVAESCSGLYGGASCSNGQAVEGSDNPPASINEPGKGWEALQGISGWWQQQGSGMHHNTTGSGGASTAEGSSNVSAAASNQCQRSAPAAGSLSWLVRSMFHACTARRPHSHAQCPLGPSLGKPSNQEESTGLAGDSGGEEDEEGQEHELLMSVEHEHGDGHGDAEEIFGPAGEEQLQQGITFVVAAVAQEPDGAAGVELEDELYPSGRPSEGGAPAQPVGGMPTANADALVPPDSSHGVGNALLGTSVLPDAAPRAGARRYSTAGKSSIRDVGSSSTVGSSSMASASAAAPAPPPLARAPSLLAPKRHLFPAGRILHMFPQSIIGPPPAGQPEGRSVTESISLFAPMPPGMRPTAADITSSRMAHHQGPYVLLEITDNQAYSRIKLCRTMVLDHLTPAYLTALDSVVQQLEAQLQRQCAVNVQAPSTPATTPAPATTASSPEVSTGGTVWDLQEAAAEAVHHLPASSHAAGDSTGSQPEAVAAEGDAAAQRPRVAKPGFMVGYDGDLL